MDPATGIRLQTNVVYNPNLIYLFLGQERLGWDSLYNVTSVI